MQKKKKKNLCDILVSKELQATRSSFLSLGLLDVYTLISYPIGLYTRCYFKGVFHFFILLFKQKILFMYTTLDHFHVTFNLTNYGRFSLKYRGVVFSGTVHKKSREPGPSHISKPILLVFHETRPRKLRLKLDFLT